MPKLISSRKCLDSISVLPCHSRLCTIWSNKRAKEKYLKKNVPISNKMPGVRCGPARQSQLCTWSKSCSHGPWGYFKVPWKHLYHLLNVMCLSIALGYPRVSLNLWCCNIVFSVCVLVVDARPEGITLGHFESMQNTLKVYVLGLTLWTRQASGTSRHDLQRLLS